MQKPSAVVGWLFTVLNSVVIGTPIAIVAAEAMRQGRLNRPTAVAALCVFGVSWVLLLIIWLAAGWRNPRRARVAWYCLLASLALMALIAMTPEQQAG
ncbi:MAG: hypothetical protein JWN86_3526 [Planctomycetota bacterium]|nr:hypothetical protein [Planctomycetota bacterium]